MDFKSKQDWKALCLGVLLIAFVVWALPDCSGNEQAKRKAVDFALTEQGIKSLDADIASVDITDQIDGKTKYVDMTVATKTLWGGHSDWNGVAASSHRLMSALLSKPEVSRARIVYRSAENKLDWAQVQVKRSELPANWRELSYLQFFAVSKPVYGSLESGRWLCEFYAKYSLANPPGTDHLMYCRD
jgi:hypothetical protein